MTAVTIHDSITNNVIYNEDCIETMSRMDDKSIDLVVTSPPYDNLRQYDGYSFDFESVANNLFRVVRQGGVVVWIVGDATINGSETRTSFKQALQFKEIGFNIHDTMIWNKGGFSAVGSLKVRYAPVFEYMFILSKGSPTTFNPIKDRKNKHGGRVVGGTIRQSDGTMKPMSKKMIINGYGQRYNIWKISPQRQKGYDKHPAPFPIQLAQDHILSWSNTGDVVYDPFMGSGTTALASILNGRKYIGSEVSKKYCALANKRIDNAIV